MKKALILLFSVLASLNLSAQKSTVVIGQVDVTSGVKSQWAEVLRSNIVSGLASSPRLIVIDGKTMNDLPSNTADAISKLRETGADCLLTAQITSFIGKTESSSDGKTTWYTATLEYSVTVTNVSDGSTRGNQKETHRGISRSGYDEAYSSAFNSISSDMKKVVSTMFRVSGEIKALAETHPKKGAKTLYVSIGSDAGISAGDILEVFKEVEIAGETISEKIGELKAKEIKSGTLTLCNVSKGGSEIMKAFDDGLKLTVVSRPLKDILGGINNVLDSVL